MIESLQKRIPRARVNITLDIKSNGANKKKELPLKLLILANFSGQQEKIAAKKTKKIEINQKNFDQVMQKICPALSFTLSNITNKKNDNSNIQLNFKSMKDFKPEHIANTIPQIKHLLAMRNLLKDLKANLVDNHDLRQHLEKILSDHEQTIGLQKYLASISPIIGSTELKPS